MLSLHFLFSNLFFSSNNHGLLGKLVFAESGPKDNEAATWREKLDQLYKSSSQSFRVVVHGSKVSTMSHFFHIQYITFTLSLSVLIFNTSAPLD